MPPPNLYVKILTLNVIALGLGGLWDVMMSKVTLHWFLTLIFLEHQRDGSLNYMQKVIFCFIMYQTDT